MRRCQYSFKKIPSNLWVVWVGYTSFQEISYAGKPQLVSKYILSNLWVQATGERERSGKNWEKSKKKVYCTLERDQ